MVRHLPAFATQNLIKNAMFLTKGWKSPTKSFIGLRELCSQAKKSRDWNLQKQLSNLKQGTFCYKIQRKKIQIEKKKTYKKKNKGFIYLKQYGNIFAIDSSIENALKIPISTLVKLDIH